MADYPNAGANAPPGVQATVEQFRRLPVVQTRDLPLLYYVLGSGTDPYKMSPAEAAYADQSSAPGQTCGNCRHSFKHNTSGNFICDQVRGFIEPPAWCRLWSS